MGVAMIFPIETASIRIELNPITMQIPFNVFTIFSFYEVASTFVFKFLRLKGIKC